MKTLKTIALALVAVLAIGATAAASAGALEFKTAKSEEAFTTSETKATTLESKGQTTVVQCTGINVKGVALGGTDKADKVLFDFTGCKESAFNSSCQSGSTGGLILTKDLHGLLVWVRSSNGTAHPGILLLSEAAGTAEAEFNCDSNLVKFKVTGGVLGQYTGGLGVEQTEFPFVFQNNGVVGTQLYTEWFETEAAAEAGTGGTAAHLTTEATGLVKFTAESSETGEGKLHTAESGSIE
jgi:hypothetical protein